LSTAAALKEVPRPSPPPRLDVWMLAGIAIAAAALLAGIAASGVRLVYFFQPTGALVVAGGTLGAFFVTTPRASLIQAFRRARELFVPPQLDHAELIDQIMALMKHARASGLLAIEPMLEGVRCSFLRESLALALDVAQRAELEDALLSRVRLRERQLESGARPFEVAGGFAPTLGVLGTVIGLLEVLRRFSDLASVAAGIGAAFVSTIYGLALANLVLLPLAYRIRARAAEAVEQDELIVEGVLCLYDRVHPSLARERLGAYLGRN